MINVNYAITSRGQFNAIYNNHEGNKQMKVVDQIVTGPIRMFVAVVIWLMTYLKFLDCLRSPAELNVSIFRLVLVVVIPFCFAVAVAIVLPIVVLNHLPVGKCYDEWYENSKQLDAIQQTFNIQAFFQGHNPFSIVALPQDQKLQVSYSNENGVELCQTIDIPEEMLESYVATGTIDFTWIDRKLKELKCMTN